MNRFSKRALLALTVIAAGLPLFLAPVVADDGDPDQAPIGQPDHPGAKPAYPRLDSQLNRIVDQLGQATPRALAEAAPISRDSSVAVTVRRSGNGAALADFLQVNGAIVANVGPDYIEAYVPVTLLTTLAEQVGVLKVQTIVPPRPAVTSQGAALHRSPIWNSRGFTGAGVKAGVIDTGFIGYSGLMGSELPATVVARCYTSIGVFTSAIADCETETIHGTGVAEAVVDIAPNVSLYVSNPVSAADLQSPQPGLSRKT
ncbi:MAG: hypothetical protein QF477_07605 [SAR202 cluster bacterium]|nr:hypothetical protein [SAR202 cluster bacterium]MDP6663916.1 hypothetical protein [SAR202 cluster bacterium]MDP6800266.1 hypothetical protein [SAR202 cluster bacterium]